MKLIFISNIQNSDLSIAYTILDERNCTLGYAEGYVNKQGDLISVIKIGKDYQGLGYGFQAFYKVFSELNIQAPIKKIIGSWHADEEFVFCEKRMSTNLKIFFECLDKTKNMERCAFSTPTGKWAIKLGFTQCKIVHAYNNHVCVEYYK